MIKPADLKEHVKDRILTTIVELLFMCHDPKSSSSYVLDVAFFHGLLAEIGSEDPSRPSIALSKIGEVLGPFVPEEPTAYRR